MNGLFTCQTTLSDGTPQPSVIRTPLGTVHLAAEIAGERLTGENADDTFWVGSRGRLWVWQRTWGVAEQLLCRPTLNLPSHLAVDDCWAAMWRVQLDNDVSGASFTCAWEPGYSWTTADPENGEYLLSFAWNDGNSLVSIGTEDEFALEFRAEHEDWMPSRFLPIVFLDQDNDEHVMIDLSPEGIQIKMPQLLSGERIQTQFVSAWRPLDEDLVATWLAVDLRGDELFAGTGCE